MNVGYVNNFGKFTQKYAIYPPQWLNYVNVAKIAEFAADLLSFPKKG